MARKLTKREFVKRKRVARKKQLRKVFPQLKGIKKTLQQENLAVIKELEKLLQS